MNRFEYAVTLTPAEEGGFVVTCHDLPQLVTQGESVEDALYEASDAMDEVFAGYMSRGKPFPLPSGLNSGQYMVSPPASTVAKAALYVAMKDACITNTELAGRLGVDEKEVRRLLDPHYASKLPRIAQAVAALGRRLVINLEFA